jgi:hypothetical protein
MDEGEVADGYDRAVRTWINDRVSARALTHFGVDCIKGGER